jgi:hypothetical protein
MTPDWKFDLIRREPSDTAEDPEAKLRIELMARVQLYMHAATKWCIEAKDSQQKVRRLRREARGAEAVASLLAVVIWYLIWRLNS